MRESSKRKYYSVYPKIVLEGKKTEITVEGLYDHSRFENGKEYKITIMPTEKVTNSQYCEIPQEVTVRAENGMIKAECCFECEQEYNLAVSCNGELVDTFFVYAVKKDLYGRFPYKGDLHMHTYYSDGMESPAYLTAACRKEGFDFIAITDHGKYFPSVEAVETFKNVPHDLCIYYGEEVHPPGDESVPEKYRTIFHFLNINGKFSVNELMYKSYNTVYNEKYIDEIADIMKKIETPAGVDKHQYAECLWCFEKIKEAEGLSVLCHPMWRVKSGYHIGKQIINHLFDNMPFDAYEMISGYDDFDVDSNTLQTAIYYEQCMKKGKYIPVVGVSDSHGAEQNRYFGWYYTIAFAKSPEFEDVAESIKNCFSVCVEKMPGAALRAYGPLRLVKLALFAVREILPEHDEICRAEGELMKRYILGENTAAQFEETSGGVRRYFDKMWGIKDRI